MRKKKLGFLSCTNLILVPGASNPQHLKRPGSPGDEDGTNLITAKKQKTLLLCSMLHRLAINLVTRIFSAFKMAPGLKKTLANNRSCDNKIANHKPAAILKTIKIFNIFGGKKTCCLSRDPTLSSSIFVDGPLDLSFTSVYVFWNRLYRSDVVCFL